jgi:uncharacterized secreted protein with C-terminal beta-propeller domain
MFGYLKMNGIGCVSTQFLVCAVILSLIAGCGSSSDNPPTTSDKTILQRVPLAELKLQQAQDCSGLKQYITDSLVKQFTTIPRYSYYSCGATQPGGDPVAAPTTGTSGEASTADNAVSAAPAPDDVSDTNNQEAGVNESDIIKADDQGNVYILSGQHLIVAKGFPPEELTTLKEINLGVRGLSLFLDKTNQRVVVMGQYHEPYYIVDPVPLTAMDSNPVVYPPPGSDYSVALFFDVSAPEDPKLIDEIKLRGYFREGRRIADRLHLVSSYYLQPGQLYQDSEFAVLRQAYWSAVEAVRCSGATSPENIAANPAVAEAKAKLVTKISSIIDNANPADYLPDAIRDNNGSIEKLPYLACTDIHFPDVNMNLGLQIISSIDTDGSNLSATGIVNNAWITYVSADNLYLADTSRGWWWVSSDDALPMSQTSIYKFAISSEKPVYAATGRVDGYVNNQFSLSEYNGKLRVATTQDDYFYTVDDQGYQQWQRERKNHLTILNDDGKGALAVEGEVRDFAPDESIRSVRYMADKAIVVTFRRIDPLFTFDLTDPAKPQLKGELTLPGFSSYIHPYDDDHVITIGMAGGTGNGMQLQLIDISDLTTPKLVSSITPATPSGWSWSAAQYDHKAFTFYKPANLLAIPMTISPQYGASVFNGIAAYEITLENGFHELGRVDHSDLAYDYYCKGNPDLKYPYIQDCSSGWYESWAAPRRSVVMTSADNIYLYTLSDVGLKASSLGDLNTALGSIVFPPQPYPWWYFGDIGVADGMAAPADATAVAVPLAL